ncbi:putative redox protein [Bowdeniella nasicola]|uniref:Putative redox protein n=1 Tax=Bowdeniella nasicola TaxID=208480 RepID=A0A1H3XW41_9ACTO|nr:hypothetical protein [Bowdeniella nasicola]SEA02782.1 putative redox protein [Bowdeniella nasicola]
MFTASTSITRDAGMKVECEARGKTIILDEPPSLGGTDFGMRC